MLKYSLRENLLTAVSSDYMAQVTDVHSYTLDEVIDLIMQKGTTITRADVATVLHVYGEVCSALIADGSALNTPLINTSTSISGIFDGINDGFDKNRHTVNLNITAGLLLREAAEKIRCEKTESLNTDPCIAEIKDVISGKTNTVLTAGGVIQISGTRLKFDVKDKTQGVFFIPEAGKAVRSAIIAENTPARVTAIIPSDLPPGTYRIEVRTKITQSSKPVKNFKTGRFDKQLTRAG